MRTLSIRRKREQQQENEGQQKTKKGLSAVGAVFLIIGILGIAVFGYLVFQNGVVNGLVGMADGIGLIVSLVVLIAGVYIK